MDYCGNYVFYLLRNHLRSVYNALFCPFLSPVSSVKSENCVKKTTILPKNLINGVICRVKGGNKPHNLVNHQNFKFKGLSGLQKVWKPIRIHFFYKTVEYWVNPVMLYDFMHTFMRPPWGARRQSCGWTFWCGASPYFFRAYHILHTTFHQKCKQKQEGRVQEILYICFFQEEWNNFKFDKGQKFVCLRG